MSAGTSSNLVANSPGSSMISSGALKSTPSDSKVGSTQGAMGKSKEGSM